MRLKEGKSSLHSPLSLPLSLDSHQQPGAMSATGVNQEKEAFNMWF